MLTRQRRIAILIGLVGWLSLVVAGSAAEAAVAVPDNDSVDMMSIDYQVGADGALTVREQIVYRFGANSGRHGIFRDLLIREPFRDDTNKDQRYDVSDVVVSSPSGVSTALATKVIKKDGGRVQMLRLQIGSADRTIGQPTAIYVISYTVRGALRHFADHSELYWDATGLGWQADILRTSVSVRVPGGVTMTQCYAGVLGATAQCSRQAVDQGVARFTQGPLTASEGLTIVAGIGAGRVANDVPLLDSPPRGLLDLSDASPAGIAGGAGVCVVAVGGALAYRRFGRRDERFVGPPGTFPPAGAQPAVRRDGLREDQIPVAFAPPRGVAVAEAALLVDATAEARSTAATLIDLAVRGALRIDNRDGVLTAVLVNLTPVTMPYEQELVRSLFPTLRPGVEVRLRRYVAGQAPLHVAHERMIDALFEQVRRRGWFRRLPAKPTTRAQKMSCGIAVLLALFVGFVVVPFGLFAVWFVAGLGTLIIVGVSVAAVLTAVILVRRGWRNGQRTAVGRAVADQVVGFRQYLLTAEADQLRFEEGQDIFSRYLPWAIAFKSAERWQRICEQAGLRPEELGWYYGPSDLRVFRADSLGVVVADSFSAPVSTNTGGGGSSSGSSGGSSGGGGGGGGGGSW